jgi:hypothetical protein
MACSTLEDCPIGTSVRNGAVFDRIVSKYRVLSQVPSSGRGTGTGRTTSTSRSIDTCFRVVLPDEFTDETLRDYISAPVLGAVRPQAHPLWDMQLICPAPSDDRSGLPHEVPPRLGDGIRLVQLLLGICDRHRTARPPTTVGLQQGFGGPSDRWAPSCTWPSTRSRTPSTTVTAGRCRRRSRRPLAAGHDSTRSSCRTISRRRFDLVQHPVKLLDALTSYSLRGQREVQLLAGDHPAAAVREADAGAWSGHPSGTKIGLWIAGIDLGGEAGRQGLRGHRQRRPHVGGLVGPDRLPARARRHDRSMTWRG